MLLGPLSFMLGRRPGIFTKVATTGGSTLGLLTPAGLNPWGWAYTRWSFLLAPSWLVELGASELPTPFHGAQGAAVSHLTWALIEAGGRARLMWLQLGPRVASGEAFFRNCRWLEREAGEMSGVVFLGKRDRRTLFGLPVFYANPLRKAFPTGGFFDLGVCPLTHKLTFRHVAWLS
jgi:hypothetical protein